MQILSVARIQDVALPVAFIHHNKLLSIENMCSIHHSAVVIAWHCRNIVQIITEYGTEDLLILAIAKSEKCNTLRWLSGVFVGSTCTCTVN